MSREPLRHIVREAPPWRTEVVLECGRNSDTAIVITHAELVVALERDGQRAAYSVCGNCFDTWGRWPTWVDDPVGTIGRDTYSPATGGLPSTSVLLERELAALAELVRLHPDEFAALLTGHLAVLHG